MARFGLILPSWAYMPVCQLPYYSRALRLVSKACMYVTSFPVNGSSILHCLLQCTNISLLPLPLSPLQPLLDSTPLHSTSPIFHAPRRTARRLDNPARPSGICKCAVHAPTHSRITIRKKGRWSLVTRAVGHIFQYNISGLTRQSTYRVATVVRNYISSTLFSTIVPPQVQLPKQN